ncbi:MAG TPA: hypothetical protein VFH15_02550 [Pyrinomonadaceae bacterium]|nr:hypothetical protein [Pyrinomonadaceae bacterium]
MNRLVLKISLATLIAVSSAFAIAAQTRITEGTLTNAAIVKLVKAGFSEKTVISLIAVRPGAFNLSAENMIALKRSNVSEKIILAMVAKQQGEVIDDDFWSDDLSARSNDPLQSNSSGIPGADGGSSTNIFGSSGGSKGKQSSRGADGALAEETMTTGSATVRIIRPPSEAGPNGTAKLERKATLTNQGVIDLVDAGFSEGTIIRRIEQSPVEFTLSAANVADLRKRRVSDKIIAAMKAAMGDDTPAETTGSNNGVPKK